MLIGIESTTLLFLFILVFSFVKLKSTQHITLNPVIDKTDKKIIGIICVLYGIFALINLGSWQNQPSSWQPKEHGIINITLNKPAQLQSLYYYSGINNGTYHWTYIGRNGSQINLLDKTASLGYPAHFKWNKISFTGVTESISQIQLTVDKPDVEIRQLAIFDINNNYITSVNVIDQINNQKLDLITKMPPLHYDDSFLTSTYFDEIFYATSAYQYLHGLNPYVSVHPPLGMQLIGTGIATFGMNAFGWRIIPAIFSILILLIMYVFTKRVLKTRVAAIFATLLLTFEPMHYVMGKIAFLDGIVTLFILTQYYFLYRYLELRRFGAKLSDCYRELFYIGIALGCGMACKWSALYFVAPLFISLIYGEIVLANPTLKEFVYSLIYNAVVLLMLPLIIYSISYIPFILSQTDNDLFKFIWRIQTYMYEFQAHGLANATHPYASSWYEWPFLKTPMSLFYWQDGNIANSVTFIANPLIVSLTFPIIILLTVLSIKNRTKMRNWFLLIAICAQYIPYAFISHIMFLYYFYSTIPLLILGIVCCHQQLFNWQNKHVRYATYLYIISVVVVFIMFLPATSGLEFPREYVTKYLLWRSGWNF